MCKIRKPKALTPKSKVTKAAPKMTPFIRKSKLPASAKELDNVQQEYILRNSRGKPIVFNSLVALCYDANVAIVLNRTIFWYQHNKKNGTHFIDGRHWTYNSIREIREDIPYLTERSIRIAIKKLLKSGIMVKAKENYNKYKYDKTSWYSIDELTVKSIFKISASDILNPHSPL